MIYIHCSVLYVQDSLESEAQVFLDPNKLSEDGTVALAKRCFSDDGGFFAYSLSYKGSDWVTIKVLIVCLHKEFIYPFTSTSDQDRISPYNIKTISSRQVMRIEKNINPGIIS